MTLKKGKLHCSHCSGEMALSQAVQQNTFQTAGGGTHRIDGEISGRCRISLSELRRADDYKR